MEVKYSELGQWVYTRQYGDNLFSPFQQLKHCEYPSGISCRCRQSELTQMIAIISGAMNFGEDDGEERQYRPGTVIVIPRQSSYHWNFPVASTTVQCVFYPLPFKDFCHLALLFGIYRKHVVAFDFDAVNIVRHQTRFEQIIAFDSPFTNVKCSVALLEMLTEMLECSGVVDRNEKEQENSAVVRAICFVDRNLRRNITMKELAKHCGLSPSRLAHLFKAQTGMTPMAHIAEQKIKLAINLLTSANLSVGETAAELGFGSINYFSRFFKQHTGISPKQAKNSSIV